MRDSLELLKRIGKGEDAMMECTLTDKRTGESTTLTEGYLVIAIKNEEDGHNGTITGVSGVLDMVHSHEMLTESIHNVLSTLPEEERNEILHYMRMRAMERVMENILQKNIN